MRILAIILGLLFVILQFDLWFGEGSLATVWRLQKQVTAQQQQNAKSRERNAALAAEVRDLKEGHAAIEERARSELGMIRKDETYLQVVEEKK